MNNYVILLNSTKTLNENAKSFTTENYPRPNTLLKAREIFPQIKNLSIKEIIDNYKVSENLAKQIQDMHLKHGQTLYRAIDMYNGTFYKQFEIKENDFEWLDQHVRIISALYGIVKPSDLLAPYRLDFKYNKLKVNLYDFWKDEIKKELQGKKIYSLLSKEFENALEDLEFIKLENSDSAGNIKVLKGKIFKEILSNKSEPTK